MSMKNLLYIFCGLFFLSFVTSCEKDEDSAVVGCMDDAANNYDPNATVACNESNPNIDCCTYDHSHHDGDDECCSGNSTPPETYGFMRNGESTVAYDGQICRVNQAAVLMNEAFTNPNNVGMLESMIQNGTGFSISACTDQVIGNKIAASGDDPVGGSYFQGWMSAIVTDLEDNVFPTWNTAAEAGVAGLIGTRHVNAHGLEPNQAFTKGLIGAMCLDQITNKYTQPDYISGQANDPSALAPGDNDTDMEHKWDEGFGYLFGMDQLANISGLTYSASGDVLLLKYAYKLQDDGLVNVSELYDLFIEGRHAIVMEDYTTRDEAAVEIKEILDFIIMQKAVDYLRGGADGIAAGPSTDDDWAEIFHDLSEGYGFVLSLMFTDAFGYGDVADMKTILDNEGGNGFWTITPDALNTMADEIESEM